MKTNRQQIAIIFSIILMIMVNGCASISPSMLKPPNKPINNKIKSLTIGLEAENVVRSEALKTVTVQTDFATIFSRTMDQNVCEMSREKWGFTDIRIVFLAEKFSILNLIYLPTFFLLPVYGAPIQMNVTMEVEIGIYDSNKQIVKKYTIDNASKYWNFLYDPQNDTRVAKIKLFQTILREFETLVNSDATYLNKELVNAGPIVDN